MYHVVQMNQSYPWQYERLRWRYDVTQSPCHACHAYVVHNPLLWMSANYSVIVLWLVHRNYGWNYDIRKSTGLKGKKIIYFVVTLKKDSVRLWQSFPQWFFNPLTEDLIVNSLLQLLQNSWQISWANLVLDQDNNLYLISLDVLISPLLDNVWIS